MSFAAWMPSSLRFFSICLLLALEARSSADMAHPMMTAETDCAREDNDDDDDHAEVVMAPPRSAVT